MTTLRKKIRNLKSEGKFQSSVFQKFINKLSNWQNSQWLRSGARPGRAEEFLSLKRRNKAIAE